MSFAPPAPLRVVPLVAGIAALGLTAEPLAAGPPTAFRVSPRVMQRLRGAPAPRPADPAEPQSGESAAPAAEPPAAPATSELPPPVFAPPADDSPVPFAPAASAPPAPGGVPADWAPAGLKQERPWRWIVVHHTATDAGSVRAIHRDHLRRRDGDGNPWRGIGYHFLVGNGEGMPDGAVEPTFRWRDQLAGAHAGRAAENDRGIGVCLVGDFEATDPTAAQLAAARRLIAFLRDRYGIPADRVLPHDSVAATACPGQRLTIAMLLAPAPVALGSADPAPLDPAPADPGRPASPGAPGGASPGAPAGDAGEDYLPTGLSGLAAPVRPSGPSLAAPGSSFPPRSGSQDAP